MQPVTNLKSLHCLRNTRLDGCDSSILDQHCQALKKEADVSEGQAEQIEKRTWKQQKSPFWFAARAGRITASYMHTDYATDIRSPLLSTVKRVCYHKDSKCTTADVTWGITNEEEARKTYIEKPRENTTAKRLQHVGFS